MKNDLLSLVEALRKLDHVDKNCIHELETFITSSRYVTRDESPEEHLCTFFIPIVQKKRVLFMGHHKKADDWIPPGGHVDAGELPEQTVKREMAEELQYRINDEKIELFDCAFKSIMKPGISCKHHYDLVYLVYLDDIVDFTFDLKEFYDARWCSFEEAATLTKTEAFKPMMNHVRDLR